MRVLQITDGEIQALVAPALRAYLRKAGFVIGASSGDEPSTFWMPVNIDLAGHVDVIRDEDGIWTFTQEENMHVADRVAEASEYHGAAIAQRGSPPCR